jgi:hypothetical protein
MDLVLTMGRVQTMDQDLRAPTQMDLDLIMDQDHKVPIKMALVLKDQGLKVQNHKVLIKMAQDLKMATTHKKKTSKHRGLFFIETV